jgi:CubicO group peptidase (beta-lactamase class C family)
MLKEVTKQTPLPGLVVSIVYDQTTILAEGFGRVNASDPENTKPPTADSLVRVASISKVFTSLLMFKLRDQGVVGIDDAVSKHVPAFSVKTPYAGARPITLGQLASHTSGLPREGPFPCNLDDRCSADEILRRMSRQYVVQPQRQRFHYSNFGFGLLGHALAAASAPSAANTSTHQPPSFEALIQQEVIEPLTMGGTFAAPLDPARFARVAQGIITESGKPAGLGALGWSSPCGGLWASASDIACMVKLMLRGDAAANRSGTQILAGATVSEALSPAVLLRDGAQAVGSPWEMKYLELGDGSTDGSTSGVWTKTKQGELPGYRSSVTIIPELKLGIFVSALQSEVAADTEPDRSVWTLNISRQLVPPLLKLLRDHQAVAPALPPHHSKLLGDYGPPDQLLTVRYTPGSNETQLEAGIGIGGAPAAFSAFMLAAFVTGDGTEVDADDDAAGVGSVVVARALALGVQGCRWLDDGVDQELLYFQFASEKADGAGSVLFMGGRYNRVGSNAKYA